MLLNPFGNKSLLITHFFEKVRLNILCESSVEQMIHLKY